MLKYVFALDDEGYVSLWSHMIYAAICVLLIEQLILSSGAVQSELYIFWLLNAHFVKFYCTMSLYSELYLTLYPFIP